ncbi:MAG TPA: T9SS type A sorting domain-containing protein [Bacteroidetes bacterium]|nr:T9SS type A sorting domain-containing protein [Bacteroidota bacterium]
MGGILIISQNPLLTDLIGFDNLGSAGYVDIQLNDALVSLAGLESLSVIEGDLFILINPLLIELTGLEGLTTVEGLFFYENEELIDISALGSIESLETELFIQNNYNLEDLTGVESIDLSNLDFLTIKENTSLSICNVENICNYLENSGVNEISDNAPGCNSVEEVEAACTVGISGLNLASSISIYPNPAQNELFISSDNGILIDEVNIYNQLGQNVIHQNHYDGSIDVSSLLPGVYFVEVVAGDDRIKEKMVIN